MLDVAEDDATGSKSPYTTSFEACGIIAAARDHTSKTACENVGRRSRAKTWVGRYLSMMRRAPCKSDAAPDVKATALLKLVYLEMYGHDMSWASFHILEVMSSVKYLHKRAGYLAAVQSFRSDTEVLMLATNLLKKAGSPYNVASASDLENGPRLRRVLRTCPRRCPRFCRCLW